MKICSNCKGTNIAEIPWGYPSRELLERSVDENDDPFVKISAMIGGDDYLKVARSLVRMQHRTCLLYTSPSPRDQRGSRMPSSA